MTVPISRTLFLFYFLSQRPSSTTSLQQFSRSKPFSTALHVELSRHNYQSSVFPYYDAGWAQSVRRDDPYSKGYNNDGPRALSYQAPSTYPGVLSSPEKISRLYPKNPTFPYYDPLWSQGYVLRGPSNVRDPSDNRYHNYYSYPRGHGYASREEDSFWYPDNNYPWGYADMAGSGRWTGGNTGYGREYNSYYNSPNIYNSGRYPNDDNYIGGWDGRNAGSSGSYYSGYGREMGPGRRLYAAPLSASTLTSPLLLRNRNPNWIRGSSRTFIFSSRPRAQMSQLSLKMSYFDPVWDGPPFDPHIPPPMPYYGRPGDRMMPPSRNLRELADISSENDSMYRDNRMNPNNFRRNTNRPGGNPMNPPIGIDPFVRPDSMGNSNAWEPSPPFGRDYAPARTSLKDMAARTTTSFDAQIINSMNNRPNARAGSTLPEANVYSKPSGKRGATTSTTSTSSQYVPLNAVSAERAPPLNVSPPPPRPFIDTNAMSVELSPTVHVARTVRPSIVLVTSMGAGNANSQGSGFVVTFDDSILDDEDEMKDRCYILTSAHVAPPGWIVSVRFPLDPDKEFPAMVVGRKLNSDLALLSVETDVDDNEEYPFPPALVLSSEDVSTSMYPNTETGKFPLSEIGSPVYAFGYPMGVEGPTMTSGILSATTKGINYMDVPTGEEGAEKSRPFENTNFVICDAAMAGGMSGGPLVNNDGVVIGVNALVRPDLRALGNYAVSSLECEEFLEKMEDELAKNAKKMFRKVANGNNPVSEDVNGRRRKRLSSTQKSDDDSSGLAGFRVMLYGYSTSKADATKILRRVAGLDENRAENAMRSAYSFGAGVVDEFYAAESGGRERAVKAARKSADDLHEKLKNEGFVVEVEPVHLLS